MTGNKVHDKRLTDKIIKKRYKKLKREKEKYISLDNI